jgi:hypothetical protein
MSNKDEKSIQEILLIFKDYLYFLKSKLIIIIIFGVFGFLLSYCFEQPNYTATLTFAMEEDKGGGSGGLGGAIGLASSIGIDLGGINSGGGAFAATNLSSLMKSHLIVEKTLLSSCEIDGKIISLADYYIQYKGLRKKWRKIPELKNISFPQKDNRSKFTRIHDSLLNVFYKDLTKNSKLSISQKDKKITIVSIDVKSKDEFFAKTFCENLAKETSDFYIETKSKKARINTNVLQKQADSVRQELSKNIYMVASETDRSYNLNPSFNVKNSKAKNIQLNVTANTEVLKQIVIQLELSKITLRKETPLIQLIDKPKFPLEKEEIGEILSSLIAMMLSIIVLLLLKFFKKN